LKAAVLAAAKLLCSAVSAADDAAPDSAAAIKIAVETCKKDYPVYSNLNIVWDARLKSGVWEVCEVVQGTQCTPGEGARISVTKHSGKPGSCVVWVTTHDPHG
jgi:hypothetical protein